MTAAWSGRPSVSWSGSVASNQARPAAGRSNTLVSEISSCRNRERRSRSRVGGPRRSAARAARRASARRTARTSSADRLWQIPASASGSSQDANPLSNGRKLMPCWAGLLLGPLVAVQIDPDRERRVGDGLDERRPPVRIADVEVVVVREDRLAAIDEMRMPVRPAVPPPAPRRGLAPGRSRPSPPRSGPHAQHAGNARERSPPSHPP